MRLIHGNLVPKVLGYQRVNLPEFGQWVAEVEFLVAWHLRPSVLLNT